MGKTCAHKKFCFLGQPNAGPIFDTGGSAIGAGLKGIVSPDWKGLQMISLDRFEV
jgi:hypothetical protein